MSDHLTTAIESFVAALPDPPDARPERIAEVRRVIDTMIEVANAVYLVEPKVDIYVRPDRTFYFHVAYANGTTFVSGCLHRRAEVVDGQRSTVGCGEAATEMVGPESLCAAHAALRREENDRHAAAVRAYMESPEGIAEARREMEWEARVS